MYHFNGLDIIGIYGSKFRSNKIVADPYAVQNSSVTRNGAGTGIQRVPYNS